jgi:hypothetical protein
MGRGSVLKLGRASPVLKDGEYSVRILKINSLAAGIKPEKGFESGDGGTK